MSSAATHKAPVPGNYCTHAIEFLKEAGPLLEETLGLPADLEAFLVECLTDAVKFILPGNGLLFAEQDYKPSMFDLQRLPFPICALEFTADDDLFKQDSGLLRAPKRIALCFDPKALSALQLNRLTKLRMGRPFAKELPARSLAIMSVYEANGLWASSTGLQLIDLDHDVPIPTDSVEALELSKVASSVQHKLGNKTTKYGLPATMLDFPGRLAFDPNYDFETSLQNLYIDTADEVRVAYEFLAALNCANVGTESIAAPKALNAKRQKKGKTPFFDYKVLNLGAAHSYEGVGAGMHASPRTHLRRGHLRRLGEKAGNKTLWINATVVNRNGPVEQGVSQTYRVKT